MDLFLVLFIFLDCTCKTGRHGNEAAGGAKESRAFKRKSSRVKRKTVSGNVGNALRRQCIWA